MLDNHTHWKGNDHKEYGCDFGLARQWPRLHFQVAFQFGFITVTLTTVLQPASEGITEKIDLLFRFQCSGFNRGGKTIMKSSKDSLVSETDHFHSLLQICTQTHTHTHTHTHIKQEHSDSSTPSGIECSPPTHEFAWSEVNIKNCSIKLPARLRGLSPGHKNNITCETRTHAGR